MKTMAIACCLLLLAGCGAVESQEQKTSRGEARIALFEKCMALAADLPRQSDDKVYKVVESCSSTSYYMTNYR